MSPVFIALFTLVASTFQTRAALQAELAALRHQIAVLQRSAPSRLRLKQSDRYQATTVSALTIIRAGFQSHHTRRSQTQKIRSAGVNFSRLGAERRNTASCCGKAMFSGHSCADV